MSKFKFLNKADLVDENGYHHFFDVVQQEYIDSLKAELKQTEAQDQIVIDNLRKENERLKIELERANFRTHIVKVVNRILLSEKKSYKEELRKTKHALWMARAEGAKREARQFFWFMSLDVSRGNKEAEIWHESLYKKWRWVESKCLAKAKEFE